MPQRSLHWPGNQNLGTLIAMSLLSLFLTSFLAGSFIPLGSEAHFLYLYNDGAPWTFLVLAAGLGNTLGGMTCFVAGKWGGRTLLLKYFKFDPDKLQSWENRLKTKSEWSALFCWLPVVGELIAASLGLLECHTGKVFFFMLLGKVARYLFILGIGHSFLT